MRRIAIIGSGIVGLTLAHALRRAGHDVALYSDRTPRQWLDESRPTGTAARFDDALSFERELGLNHWDDVAPRGEGVFVTFCPKFRNPLVRLYGRNERPFQAVDLRLQCARWLTDFDGRTFIEPVGIDRLDAIAGENELTIVAAGRAELARLFPRDDSRSVHTKPARHLAMVITKGAAMSIETAPFLPVKFDFLGTDGELFSIPYFHKDHGPTWNLLFEAHPGSRMDRFGEARNGEEMVRVAKQVVRELFPWNEEWMRPMEIADPNGWLTGAFTPVVRKPVGTLPSGRVVMPIGDTAISFDPIAAQGANTGLKQARYVARAIAAHDGALDATWMTRTFDNFWETCARYAWEFSNLLLEKLTPPAQEILIAQYRSDGVSANGRQKIANAFMENFNDPRLLTPAFTDMHLARSFIAESTGAPWIVAAARGRAAILRDQLRLHLHPPRWPDACAVEGA